MSKGPVTWQDKLCRLEGGRRKGVTTRIAKRLRRSVQTVYHWIEDGMTPRNEDAILDLISERYGVTRAWLKNGLDDDPPLAGRAATPELMRAIEASSAPDYVKEVALALTDEGAARFLAEQLRVYRATVDPRRRT